MKYITKKVGEPAKVNECRSMTLDILQEAVEGLIEPVYISKYIVYVNDEGKLIGKDPNIILTKSGEPVDTLHGDVLITKSDGEGGDTSLDNDDINHCMAMLNHPMMYGVNDAGGRLYILPTIELT